jgi:hypothetical protein
MTLLSNLQSFAPGASGTAISNLTPVFHTGMDSVLLGMGRNITLHLQPSKSKCTAAGCRFNSTYQKFIGPDGQPCRACGGQGFFLEPRQTVYMANIRWLDDSLAGPSTNGEAMTAGRVMDADVRTKTVAVSMNDILNCVAAEIDGIPVRLKGEPRRTGFGGQLLYVVAFWENASKKTNV